MALVPCKSCGAPVSKAARVCPRCGVSWPNPQALLRRLAMKAGLAALFLSAAILYGWWSLRGLMSELVAH